MNNINEAKKKKLLLLLFCSIFFNNLFAQSDLKTDGKKIIESAIEVGSGEKEIITVLKSVNNFEIGFEVGVSTSGMMIGESENRESTMATATKPYFSSKVSTTFENLPTYMNDMPYYWELTFSSKVMDRQQLDNDTIWESQKVGTEVTVNTYQFVWNVVPKWGQYHHEDFDSYFLAGIVIQHNTIKGDYYKEDIDNPRSIDEKECDVASTPSGVKNYCEKKTINKRFFGGGMVFGGHWVIPKYYSNLGLKFFASESFDIRFYYGFYYAF
jgi:hypothetical protein